MSLVREYGTQLVTQFTVPYRGTWRSVAVNQLTPDTLYASSNVFLRQGKLRERPGLALLNTTVFDAPVIGAAMAVTPGSKIVLAVTKSQLYTLMAGNIVWQVDSPLSIGANDNSVVDIAFTETSSQYYALLASGAAQLHKWADGQGVSVVANSPVAKSVCVAARRVVALVHPHTVAWSVTLTIDDWPELASYKIAATNDVGVCVKTLSNLSFVLYKERSIYTARAQAGSDAVGFTFSEPIKIEGPAGVHAVVDVSGAHIYMTKNGRIATFNGTQYPEWIGDGLWLYLQDDIDPVHAGKIFGVFDYRLHTVLFIYPRRGDDGQMMGMVLINMPLDGSGIEQPAFFLGQSAVPLGYGCEARFDDRIDQSLLFSSTVGDAQSFNFDETYGYDDGVPFTCSFQTPLMAVPDMKHFQLSIESFLERARSNGTVTVSGVTLDILENMSGTVDVVSPQIIDLNNNPVQEHMAFNVPARFFGLQYVWQSTSKVRYAGASVYGRALT